MLHYNKRLFWNLLGELENGADLKFKVLTNIPMSHYSILQEVFLTFINIAIVNTKKLFKRMYLRDLCIITGLQEAFLVVM